MILPGWQAIPAERFRLAAAPGTDLGRDLPPSRTAHAARCPAGRAGGDLPDLPDELCGGADAGRRAAGDDGGARDLSGACGSSSIWAARRCWRRCSSVCARRRFWLPLSSLFRQNSARGSTGACGGGTQMVWRRAGADIRGNRRGGAVPAGSAGAGGPAGCAWSPGDARRRLACRADGRLPVAVALDLPLRDGGTGACHAGRARIERLAGGGRDAAARRLVAGAGHGAVPGGAPLDRARASGTAGDGAGQCRNGTALRAALAAAGAAGHRGAPMAGWPIRSGCRAGRGCAG